MRIKILSSGSKGNTTYIECNNTKILIDAGNCCKYIVDKLRNMGIKGNEIDAIFITHTHSDHIKGLKVFVNKFNPLIFVTEEMLGDLDYITNYKVIKNNSFTFRDLSIDVIKTSHDAPGSVGYVIGGDGKSIVYITDTGYINNKYNEILSNRELYVMESNHDIEMLNNGRYPFRLRQRILSDKGHLSNYDSSRYLSSYIGNKTKCIVLAHLSEENNTYDLAYDSLIERLESNKQKVSKIVIAKQDIETEMLEV